MTHSDGMPRYDLHEKYETLHNGQVGDISELVQKMQAMQKSLDAATQQINTDKADITTNKNVRAHQQGNTPLSTPAPCSCTPERGCCLRRRRLAIARDHREAPARRPTWLG